MVKLQGRWFEPFLVRFPLLKVKKGSVGDEQVRKRMVELGFAHEEREEVEVQRPFKNGDTAVSDSGGQEGVTLNEKLLLLVFTIIQLRLSPRGMSGLVLIPTRGTGQRIH